MKYLKHLLFLSILCSLVVFTNCGEDEQDDRLFLESHEGIWLNELEEIYYAFEISDGEINHKSIEDNLCLFNLTGVNSLIYLTDRTVYEKYIGDDDNGNKIYETGDLNIHTTTEYIGHYQVLKDGDWYNSDLSVSDYMHLRCNDDRGINCTNIILKYRITSFGDQISLGIEIGTISTANNNEKIFAGESDNSTSYTYTKTSSGPIIDLLNELPNCD